MSEPPSLTVSQRASSTAPLSPPNTTSLEAELEREQERERESEERESEERERKLREKEGGRKVHYIAC